MEGKRSVSPTGALGSRCSAPPRACSAGWGRDSGTHAVGADAERRLLPTGDCASERRGIFCMSAEALVRTVTGLLEAGPDSSLLASSVLRPSGRLRRTMRRPLWTDGDEGAPCPTAPGDLDHGIHVRRRTGERLAGWTSELSPPFRCGHTGIAVSAVTPGRETRAGRACRVRGRRD